MSLYLAKPVTNFVKKIIIIMFNCMKGYLLQKDYVGDSSNPVLCSKNYLRLIRAS